jgi:chromate reductase, NAD(P)H dehydrogenase (quinone)
LSPSILSPVPTLLALSGSLRAASTNTALLRAAAARAPAGLRLEIYDGMGGLPLFNPDILEIPPAPVASLMARVDAADGLLIACPEYARGIPGAFKNLLDWLVGSTTFPGKPVALWNASPRATEAQTALLLVLSTMSARIVSEASATLPLLGKDMDAAAILEDADLTRAIDHALAAYAAALAG